MANVPLHHDDPGGPGRVELLVGVVDNGGAAAGQPPVLFLQGGPGIGAVERASRFIGLPYDVVVIDQRGTGGSSPKLSCPEVDALWVSERSADPANSADDDIVFAAYEACADRLRAEDIDLDAFNTDTAAADTEVVRRLLGHAPWTLWGASYGTRVAQTVMRNHADGVRAAVLDSVVPFDVDFFASIPENALRAIDQLDRACEADRCLTDHGDFGDELAEQVLAYGASPAIVTVTRPGSGTTFDYRVGGTDLIDFVFVQLYSTSALRALPRQISRADFGGVDELVTGYASRRDPEVLDLAIGAYYAAWCREEFPFHDPTADDAAVAAGNARFGTAFEDALASTSIDRLCGFFDVAPGPAELDMALSSDLPTLVFAGSFDPITPPAWSRSVADSIAGSTYVEFPDHGHGMTSSCAATIMAAFVADPLTPPDTTCVAAFGPPDFE